MIILHCGYRALTEGCEGEAETLSFNGKEVDIIMPNDRPPFIIYHMDKLCGEWGLAQCHLPAGYPRSLNDTHITRKKR